MDVVDDVMELVVVVLVVKVVIGLVASNPVTTHFNPTHTLLSSSAEVVLVLNDEVVGVTRSTSHSGKTSHRLLSSGFVTRAPSG